MLAARSLTEIKAEALWGNVIASSVGFATAIVEVLASVGFGVFIIFGKDLKGEIRGTGRISLAEGKGPFDLKVAI